MRMSLSQQVQSALMHVSTASNRLVGAQDRAASGKRILRASDDVPGTDRALSLRSAISTLDQFSDNTTVGKPLLQVTEQALGEMVSTIQSVRAKAMAAGNGALDEAARATYATELDELLKQMADIANTRYMGQYVFSGTASDSAAVVAQAGPQPYAYSGNSDTRRIQILSGILIPVNSPGDQAFNFDGGAGTGTTDVFAMVTQLREAVISGNTTAISAELDNIDANLNNVLSCRAQVGSRLMRIERAQNVLADTKVRLGELLSITEDIDLAEAVIELKSQENVYQAALAVSTRILGSVTG